MDSTPPYQPLRVAASCLVVSLLVLLGLGAWAGGLLPLGLGEATVSVRSPRPDDRPTIPRCDLRDTLGTLHQVGGQSEAPATVVVFLSPTCPISRSYVPMLGRLHRAAASRRVRVLGILVAGNEDSTSEFRVGFPLVSETSRPEARALRACLGPTHVPEAFVIDSSGRLCYRGRIDDHYIDVGRRRQQTTHRDLARAIDTVLSGGSRELTRTPPVGCLLDSPPGEAEPAKSVTWSSHVAELVHRRCGRCHRAETPAPFPLRTYDDVAARSRQVLDVVTRRIMPPWKPRPEFGHFRDELRLDDSELALLRKWLESGLPRGDMATAPVAPVYRGGWVLGEPDLVLTMPEAALIPAEGDDVYWYFVIPSGLVSDRMITAIDFRPGNSRVVHHASFRYDDTGRARLLDATDPAPGYRRHGGWGFSSGGTLGGWAAGIQPQRLAPGLGRPITAGSDFVLQVHYHPTGQPEQDRSRVGIYFLPERSPSVGSAAPEITPVVEIFVGDMSLEIPPGRSDLYHPAEYTLPVPVTIHSVLPHMHLLGRRCRSWAVLPNGRKVPLVAVDDWDFNWQGQYHLRKPLKLPAGTRLVHESWYDNSSGNPFNPHSPPRRVTWGEGTSAEMGLLLLDVTADTASDRTKLIRHNWSHFAEQYRRLSGSR